MSKKNIQNKENRNNLVVDLLNTFSKKEMKGLHDFANCEYFNTDKYVIKLIEVLREDVLGKERSDVAAKSVVYQKVFPDKVSAKGLNDEQKKRLNAKLTMLTRVVEHFLSIEVFEADKAYQRDSLCQKLLEKEQYQLLERTTKKEKKILNSQNAKDMLYHKRHYNLSKNILRHVHETGKLHKEDNISEVLYHIDVRSCMEKAQHYMTMLSLINTRDKKYNTSSMDITLKMLDLPQYAKHPMLQVYKVVIQLMKKEDEDTYGELLNLLESNAAHIPRKKLILFYGTLINSCVRQIREEKLSHRDLFNLYRKIDKKDLMIDDDFIHIIKLKNAVTVGCRVDEFKWATKIIKKYKPFVNTSIQKSVWHYNLGVIAFYQKDYSKARHHFIRTENVHVKYDTNCRVMLLKSFYENDKEYDEKTMTKFRSANKFFHTHKQLSSTEKREHKNFVRILVYVYKFRHRNITLTKMPLENIKERLKRQDVNSDKGWLLQKIQELKK